MTDRFIAPLDDPNGTFDQIARALDTASPLSEYAPSTAATVNVAPGAFKRLSPRAAGQTVLLPRADGSNTARELTLFVEGALGSLTLRPVSGTINGASSLVFSGATYLVTLTSNGYGGWALRSLADSSVVTNMLAALSVTTAKIAANAVTNAKLAQMAASTLKGRALGAGTGDPTDLTGAEVADIIETEGYSWTGNWNLNNRIRLSNVFAQTLTGNTDNLAIGAVNVVRISGAGFNLTGMVPDANDHIVWLMNSSSTSTLVLKHDVTSTAANRFVLPGGVDHTMPLRSACWARYDPTALRWFVTAGS